MQSVRRSVLVAHSTKEMFDLVDGIELYPQFLPWCGGARVLETRADGKTARIDIDFRGVRAHFTTDNVIRANESIVIALRDGPFRQLHGEWRFAALAPDSCKVSLALVYEFMAPLELVVGPVFGRIATTLMDSFVRRADALYRAGWMDPAS
jgi:ribosome-associated toxin RatA of RatAB toxin-antitoxin module